jgi:hypothetical protein
MTDTIVPTQQLTYRRSCDADLPALLSFWEAHTGWGRVTEAQWRTWFHDGPWGPATVVIAQDAEGRLAAQMVFAPSPLWIDGSSVRGARLSAPIVRPDLRDTTVRRATNPILSLYFCGIDALRADGVSAVFARPAPAWAPFLQLMQRVMPYAPGRAHYALRQIAAYPCAQRESTAALSPPEPGFRIDTAADDHEFDSLWERARNALPVQCASVRDATFVRFRLGGYKIVVVRDDDGALAGYVAIDTKARLVVDVLADTPARLEAVLCTGLSHYLCESPGILKAVQSPLLTPTLDRLAFAQTDYEFLLACDWLDGRQDLASLTRDRWYLGAND